MPINLAVIELSSLDGTNGFQINGEAADDISGFSVSSAGDVNGDGFDDLIIGANGVDTNGNNSGASYVVFGKASGFAATIDLSTLDGTNGFQINGEAAGDYSGRSVSSAGDVNGDGFDDLIIGAFFADSNGSDSGASYVVFGKGPLSGGFAATIDLSTLDGTNGFQINGEAADDRSGRSVSSAGDVNGDGFDDLIIGAYVADPNGNNSGASYVVFGKEDWSLTATIDFLTLDGTNGFRLNGEAASDSSGRSVSSAGDVNDDGFDDLIIGANGVDTNGNNSGASYVVFGKASGFAATIDLSTLDGTNGFQINGEAAGDRSGRSVSSAGDVNGDGFDDLIIGAYVADPNGNYSGASYVVFGKASGFAATIDLSTLDGTNGFQISGEAVNDLSCYSVSSAGDVNGDGFDDLIIGAMGADPNGSESDGASYVVFGKASGFAANINLSTLNGTNGFQINGEAVYDSSGRSVSSAGDVNGDGFADLIIGAYGGDTNGGNSGASYVVFGKATGTLNRLGDDAANILSGGDWDDTFVGLGGNDLIRAGGGDDTINGGADDDTLNGGADNDVINGGSGTDSLDGGSGADSLFGGSGSDTYFTDGFDTLVELAGSGLDIVNSTASLTLSANFENLNLLGSASNGTGNELANTITGNGGNNVLNGGVDGFIDNLIGLLGNDTYVLGASTNDVVTDSGGTADLITSTITRSLAGFTAIENLTLLGSSAINGTGNGLANIITGNSAKNTLIGGLGADTLIGGAGADSFRYNLHTEGLDKITNFDAMDFMVFKGSAFGGLTTANKAAGFVSRATSNAALDASDRLIFRQSDDTLWYDSNGSTAGGTKIMIADFSNNFNLTASDILIV